MLLGTGTPITETAVAVIDWVAAPELLLFAIVADEFDFVTKAAELFAARAAPIPLTPPEKVLWSFPPTVVAEVTCWKAPPKAPLVETVSKFWADEKVEDEEVALE